MKLGASRGLLGQRAGSDDGRHSFGSCCLEDVAVACRPPSGELTHAPAVSTCREDTAVNITFVLGGAQEPRSGVPGWSGGPAGRRFRRLRGSPHGSLPEQGPAAFCGADHQRRQRGGQGSTALRGAGPRAPRVGSLTWVWWRRSPT